EALLDPSELFRKAEAQGEIDNEDATYWNVELIQPEVEPLMAETVQPVLVEGLKADPLIQEAIRLGGVITETEQPERKESAAMLSDSVSQPLAQAIFDYLDTVHIITDEQKLAVLRADLLTLL